MVKNHFKDGIFAICFTIVILFLQGCASTKQIEYRMADIPEPPHITRPYLDVLDINTDMDPGTIIQLHRSTIIKLKSWGLELEAALDAYRKPKDIK